MSRRARIVACAGAALLAFAGNSICCRLALRSDAIDPASFTTLRLVSGAMVLVPLARWLRGGTVPRAGSWPAALALAVYAAAFSFAYVQLSAATGTLLLFGAVQLTMLGAAFAAGERLSPRARIGTVLALLGLVVLTAPELEGGSLAGTLSMAIAGFAWGVYSLRGRSSADPIAATCANFVRASLLAVPLLLPMALFGGSSPRPSGVLLAVVSGALTSGVGYVLWYHVLPTLGAARAAIVQLLVPVLTALLAVLALGEAATVTLAIASLLVLGGVWVAVAKPAAATGGPAPGAGSRLRSRTRR